MFQDLYWQDVFNQPARLEETRHDTAIVTRECILEALELVAGSDLVYAFELRRGDTLRFTICASRAIQVLLCSFVDYERWLDSTEAEAEIELVREVPDVRSETLLFQSPVDDELAVILVNPNPRETQVLVEAHVS